MGQYKLVLTKAAVKDYKYIKQAGLDKKIQHLFEILKNNPYDESSDFEALKGDLKGLYSKRINYQHRLIYQIFKEEKVVKIISLWNHYS